MDARAAASHGVLDGLQCSVSGREDVGSGFSSCSRPARGVARRCASGSVSDDTRVAAGSGVGMPVSAALSAAAEKARRP